MTQTTLWIYAISAALLVSLLSLIGLFVISRNTKKFNEKMVFIISLAVGALLGNAFLHLLPEAAEGGFSESAIALFVLGGIFFFFILDKYLHWHCRHNKCAIKPAGHKALIADGVHNILDGFVIGTAFLVSVELGIAATIAVALHEIPQEVADFGILVNAGFTKARALFLNFLFALTAVAGATIALTIGTRIESFVPAMLAVTGGMFIYLAAVDLIPDLHHGKTTTGATVVQILGIIIGIGAMWFLI